MATQLFSGRTADVGSPIRNSEGAMNGATRVVAVPAPPQGSYRVLAAITMDNVDTAPRELIVFIVKAATARRIHRSVAIAAGQVGRFEPVNGIVIDQPDETIEVATDAAPATTNPNWTAHWAEPAE